MRHLRSRAESKWKFVKEKTMQFFSFRLSPVSGILGAAEKCKFSQVKIFETFEFFGWPGFAKPIIIIYCLLSFMIVIILIVISLSFWSSIQRELWDKVFPREPYDGSHFWSERWSFEGKTEGSSKKGLQRIPKAVKALPRFPKAPPRSSKENPLGPPTWK